MTGKPSIRLKQWRIGQELSQPEAAKQFGISSRHLSAIECGTVLPGGPLSILIETLTGVRFGATPANGCEECGTQIADNSRMCDECSMVTK